MLEAIAAGVAVIADKPLHPTRKRGVSWPMPRAKGVVLSVYHNRRFDHDVRTLKKLIEQNRVGKVWRRINRMDFDDANTSKAAKLAACCVI
ncbi:hypothetical protein LZ023_35385 (plasmid) [Pseudomonas silvicola]|nr:hypothetical protein LZ023_35385 [Pseudomonas silvicola]